MIDILLSSVLPVFAVVAIGYGVGWAGLFAAAEAAALNRYVFFIAMPVLGFRLLGRADFGAFDWSVLAAYAGVECVIYVFAYLVARRLFRRGVRESVLIAMACMFANHVFFVLPIAVELIGEAATVPIIGVVTVDAVVFYTGTMLLLEAIGEGGVAMAFARVARNIVRNPQILAMAGGIAVGLSGYAFAPGIELFTRFVADTAAPVSLFALGVVLSGLKGPEGYGPAVAIAATKLVVLPALMIAAISLVHDVSADWRAPMLMVAAGPVGAMPFVLALQYDVPPAAVARALVISTLGSLLTVSYAASLAVGP